MTKHELNILADKVAIAIKIERDKPLKKGDDRYFSEHFTYITNPINKRIYESDKSRLGFKQWDKMTPHERTVWELSKYNGEMLSLIEIYSNGIINKYKKELEEKSLEDEIKKAKAKKEHEKKTPELTTEQLSFSSYK